MEFVKNLVQQVLTMTEIVYQIQNVIMLMDVEFALQPDFAMNACLIMKVNLNALHNSCCLQSFSPTLWLLSC